MNIFYYSVSHPQVQVQTVESYRIDMIQLEEISGVWGFKMKSFIAALNQMRGARNLVLCHDQADSDAVGAAYAICQWIGGDIGVPSAVATHTHQLLDRLGTDVVENPNLTAYTHIILVDCASPVQLGTCLPSKYWLIDHHPDNCLIENAVESFYEVRSSTCQLVYRLMKEAKLVPDGLTATALCAGILTDTINFHKGDDEAFRSFGELLQVGRLTYGAIQDLYGISEREDRGAIIESALRARKFSVNGFHVLVTEIDRNIPTFAARALLDLGADISIVGYQREQDVEIRMYLRQEVSHTFKINADDLLREVQAAQPAKIWGYKLFAGYRSSGDLKTLLDSIIGVVKSQLTKQT